MDFSKGVTDDQTQQSRDILVIVAVGLFATHTRDAKEITRLLDTTEWKVYQWTEREKSGRI